MAPVVVYHYPCPDGACGALAAYVHFAAKGEAAAVRWVPLTTFEPEAARTAKVDSLFTPEDDVYLVDFSGGASFMLAACARAKTVALIDHHKTAADDLAALRAQGALPANLDVSHVDMARSGATLARNYFAISGAPLLAAVGGDASRAAALDRLFALVEDNDLWKHQVPGSKEFAAGLAALKLELDANKNPALFATLLSVDVDATIASGREAMERDARIISEELATAYAVEVPPPEGSGLPPMQCLAVVSTHPDLRSTAGNHLANIAAAGGGLAPVGIIAYTEAGVAEGSIKVSMRSLGDYDVTPYARALGGGGHKNASSCVVPLAVFNSWRKASDL